VPTKILIANITDMDGKFCITVGHVGTLTQSVKGDGS